MPAANSAKRPFMGALVFAVVGGLGVVSMLPGTGLTPPAIAETALATPALAPTAIAGDRPLAAGAGSEIDPQSIQLSEGLQRGAAASVREVFDAQSVEQQREAMAAGYRTTFIATPGFIGNDYPWSGITWGQSSLNYTMGQCTDFAAWRLNRDVGSYGEPWALPWSVLTPNGGNARDWYDAWLNNGWLTSSEPVVGSIAWFGYGANHVAYVSAVNGDGTILIEEYNWDVTSGYGARTIAASSIPAFLYPPG
ncbi:MAG TPA: CHAP domain-containing protein [Microbacteriaceae bacterium]|nr:CHAP domain-containing protein [Microbacteriaceae bacterium]